MIISKVAKTSSKFRLAKCIFRQLCFFKLTVVINCFQSTSLTADIDILYLPIGYITKTGDSSIDMAVLYCVITSDVHEAILRLLIKQDIQKVKGN